MSGAAKFFGMKTGIEKERACLHDLHRLFYLQPTFIIEMNDPNESLSRNKKLKHETASDAYLHISCADQCNRPDVA